MKAWNLPPIRFFVCLKCETIHRADDMDGPLAFIRCEICDQTRIMYRVDYEQAKIIDPRVGTAIAIHNFNKSIHAAFGPAIDAIVRVLNKYTKGFPEDT